MYISPHLHVGSSLGVGRRAGYEEPVSFVVWIVLSNHSAQLCQPWKWAPGAWWPLITLAPPRGQGTVRGKLPGTYPTLVPNELAGWSCWQAVEAHSAIRSGLAGQGPETGPPAGPCCVGGAPGLQVQLDSKLRPPGAQVCESAGAQAGGLGALACVSVRLTDLSLE